jgi:hypothetical protein
MIMTGLCYRLTGAILLALPMLPTTLPAQQPAVPMPVPVTYGDGRRAQATRAELEATLVEIGEVVSSPGYSGRLRDARRREADLIRERLQAGDLQVGDQIDLTVLGETQFTGIFLVGAGQVLSLPGMPDISLKGVLRAEAQDYLTEQLRRQIRDPRIQVRTSVRLTFNGAVARPGFYQVPADIMPTDAVMAAAGGFAGGGDPNRMVVRRQGREIWSREAFQGAILRGMTLDQMNLRTSDEILVEARNPPPITAIMAGLGFVSSMAFLIFRVF